MCAFNLHFINSYAKLPGAFYTKMPPENFAKDPWVIHVNEQAAQLIGLSSSDIKHPDFPSFFSGNKVMDGSIPLAQVYSGHQFGQWAGQLGDGRALLLGQVKNKKNELWDIQLKGSGKTPYSRFGDGRAVLRSCIREYLCSENIHALGIPTTRSLSIIGTGQPVFRETAEPGAVFTRLSPSHIRFGHFEHFNALNEPDLIQQLLDYLIQEHYPSLENNKDKYLLFFDEIIKGTAHLIAQWQAVGFCHGVMNTDNMSALGLTIDYGPFGFMEGFNPAFICNHSDRMGRYAYDQQPVIGLWNLHAFAYSLSSLIPTSEATELLKSYDPYLTNYYNGLMRQKIGFLPSHSEMDPLWISLVELMITDQSDYTLSFRYLSQSFNDQNSWLSLFYSKERAKKWLENYHQIVGKSKDQFIQHLNQVNPKYVLRNWVAEKAIRAAEDHHDYYELDDLLTILQSPFDEHPAYDDYAAPAPKEYQNLAVSCSS